MAGLNKRLLLESLGEFRLTEDPIPHAPEGGAVVKITNAGICYSDVHMAHTPKFHPKFVFPRVLGHEISGEVHELSAGAQKCRPDLCIGDRVMVFPWGNCNECNYCRGGCTFCQTMAYGAGPVDTFVYGVWRDGGYENYMAVDVPEFLIKVPDSIQMDQASILPCSGLTSYNAAMCLRESVERAKRVNGIARVALVGTGGLGLWAIQIVKALYSPGVEVVAIDISEEKLKDAKDHGEDFTHRWGKDESAQDAVDALVEDCGRMDGVLDFIGVSNVIERSFLSLNIGGTLTLVGLSGNMMPAMTLNSIIRKNVTVRGSLVGSLNQLKELLDLVVNGKVVPPPVFTVNLEDVPATMDKMRQGTQRGRAVIQM